MKLLFLSSVIYGIVHPVFRYSVLRDSIRHDRGILSLPLPKAVMLTSNVVI